MIFISLNFDPSIINELMFKDVTFILSVCRWKIYEFVQVGTSIVWLIDPFFIGVAPWGGWNYY